MSLAEMLIVLVLLLVVVGPERLPKVARVVGKGFREIRRATNMFRDTMQIDDDPLEADTLDQPIDRQVDHDQDHAVEHDPHALADPEPHATGGYGRAEEMRTETVDAADAGGAVDYIELEAAESTDATRWIYVPHPHRNILY